MKKSYIDFDKLPRIKGAKTDKWEVYTGGKGHDEQGPQVAELGAVWWWWAWRRYVFFPNEGTMYDPGCLREIADFCERETRNHPRKEGEG